MTEQDIYWQDKPNCATADCEHKVCTWASEKYCYPCTEKRHGKAYMDEAYERTHGKGKGFYHYDESKNI